MDTEVTIAFPKRYKPLPPGYEVVWLDGHFRWTYGTPEERANDDYSLEGFISWDRFWVRRCAFAHFEDKGKAHNGDHRNR